MSTTTISFTADAAGIGLGGSKFYGPPAELSKNDVKTQDPVAYTVAQEFLDNGTTSGTVTITAV